MTETLTYRALLNLQTAIRSIGSRAEDFYKVEAKSVSLDPMDIVSIQTGRAKASPFFVIELAPSNRPSYGKSDQILEIIPVNIVGYVNAAAGDPLSRLMSYERLCADVERAIHADVKLGGLVGDVRIGPKQMQAVMGSQRVTAIIQIDLRTYRFYGSP